MPSSQDKLIEGKPIVRIAPNNQVFDLPVIVAIEEGLFARAGLDVRFSATHADREKDSAQRPVMSRLKEQLFDCGSAGSHNACEGARLDPLAARAPRGRHARLPGPGAAADDPPLR